MLCLLEEKKIYKSFRLFLHCRFIFSLFHLFNLITYFFMDSCILILHCGLLFNATIFIWLFKLLNSFDHCEIFQLSPLFSDIPPLLWALFCLFECYFTFWCCKILQAQVVYFRASIFTNSHFSKEHGSFYIGEWC